MHVTIQYHEITEDYVAEPPHHSQRKLSGVWDWLNLFCIANLSGFPINNHFRLCQEVFSQALYRFVE